VVLASGGIDVSFTAISRAPIGQIAAYKQRMGWSFRWVSSGETDFNYDFGASFTPEEVASHAAVFNYGSEPGFEDREAISVFVTDAPGRVFHTYSQYARGLESTGGSYYFLDLTALGRQEEWEEPKGRTESARSATPDFGS